MPNHENLKSGNIYIYIYIYCFIRSGSKELKASSKFILMQLYCRVNVHQHGQYHLRIC